MFGKTQPRTLLALLSCALSTLGCSTVSPALPPTPIAAAALPPLPPEARQPPAPDWCSPTCTEALTQRRQNSLRSLTLPGVPASPASASTTQ